MTMRNSNWLAICRIFLRNNIIIATSIIVLNGCGNTSTGQDMTDQATDSNRTDLDTSILSRDTSSYTDGDYQSDTDLNSDADSNSYADTDSDSDTDSDTDTDTDTDSDSDIDADADVDSDTEMDSDSVDFPDSETTTDSIGNDSLSDSDTQSLFDNDGRLIPTEDCIHPDVVSDCKDGWCSIPSGCFVFGSRDTEGNLCRSKYAETQVQVTLTRDFEIRNTELTQAEWQSAGFDLPNPLSQMPCEDCAVTWITVYEAMAYCNVLSQKAGLEECYDLSSCTGTIGGGCPDDQLYFCDGDNTDVYICTENVQRYSEDPYSCLGYRLPTTTEWEYAARAGTNTANYAGDLEDDIQKVCEPHALVDTLAWHCGNVESNTNFVDEFERISIPAAQKQPNGFGLYDMLGGYGEFCASTRRNESLESLVEKEGPLVDPSPPLELFDENMRIFIRGGEYTQEACYSRSAYGHGGARAPIRRLSWGFRPVRTLGTSSEERTFFKWWL